VAGVNGLAAATGETASSKAASAATNGLRRRAWSMAIPLRREWLAGSVAGRTIDVNVRIARFAVGCDGHRTARYRP
jgi:hypothetical protein